MNQLQKLLKNRQNLNRAIRDFFASNGYLEADSPLLAPSVIPESYLEVFETSLRAPNLRDAKPAYLLASPEAFLKRLIVQDSGSIYYLGKAFRNGEPFGSKHNHEFTILEWYRIGYDYHQLMKEIEQMITYITINSHSTVRLNFSKPWEYLTIKEAGSRFAPGHKITPENFENLYVKYLEPNLGTRGVPTFIYDFPAWQSPLAKSANGLAERFELYINGVELINGWTELTDSKIQEKNLVTQNEERLKIGKQKLPLDFGFIQSLKQGMPECAGAAMGVDRLLMVLFGYSSIQEVIPFSSKTLFGKN